MDTWLAVHADNTATIYIGFAELEQGGSTALLQMAAEELDLDMSQIKTVRLDIKLRRIRLGGIVAKRRVGVW
jgi:CO/xanthine dehydrogenase Mo-binding subunit